MALNPVVRILLKIMNRTPVPDPPPSVREQRAAEARETRLIERLARRPPELRSVVDHQVDVDGGQIMVRVYTPRGTGPFPVHVYAHGGAFCFGSVAGYDRLTRTYSGRSGCVVVSVDYRLAPEHPFPTGPEDCYAALLWTVAHAAELDIDPSRVSVGGTSAGGSLAAAMALMSRDRGGPALAFQLLEIPVTDATLSGDSMQQFGEGYLLTRTSMEQAVTHYLPDPSRIGDPYASPLLAPDLSGLPPARIMTCEYDPLRDQGEAYGRRLRDAGVPATVTRYPGHIHASSYMTRVIPSAHRYVEDVCKALQAAHGTRRVADGRR